MAFSRRSVRIDGLKDLDAALSDFSKATAGNILKRAVGAAGAMIAEHAIEIAPEDTGNLKREIKVSTPKIISPGKAAFAQAMRETGDRAIAAEAAHAANREAGGSGRSAVAQVGPTKKAGEGILQEFGTVKMRAQPFMRPTWDAYDDAALEVIKETLAEEIDKAAARAEKKAAKLAAQIAASK